RKFNRVERRHTFIRHAFRMCERIEHRELHRRDAHLGEHTAVDELDEGVNYALWMDNYVDALVGKPEQEMSFDYLERLVGECRAIDGDLASHSPRRMTKRVIYSRGGESLGAPVPERSAGRGEHDTPNLRCRMSGDALEDRAVLAVDGHHFTRPRCARLPHEVAGNYERFLVGQSNPLAALACDESRVKSGNPDDRVENDVNIVTRRSCNESLSPAIPRIVHITLRLDH